MSSDKFLDSNESKISLYKINNDIDDLNNETWNGQSGQEYYIKYSISA